MLEDLKEQPKDKILMLMEMYRADPRETKIDLGVGVYKNADGVTPIMRSVKAAEQQLWKTETTKSYTGLAGDPAYTGAMCDLILGDTVDADRVAAIATPGGTGAIHQALELIRITAPEATIWLSQPTWPNHPTMIRHIGLKSRDYRYFDDETCEVDFHGMMQDLSQVRPGDVVLLHGCCHNPTGANLTEEQWEIVTDHLAAAEATPLIDIAYQGFGDGLDADALGTRMVARKLPEAMIAASCSKNFGIYRERTGVLLGVAPSAKGKPALQGTLAHINRQNFSFPPDHGARLVSMILTDDALRADWQAELEEVRLSMLALREQLAAELRQRTNSGRFDFVADHRGMFSRLGATTEQVTQLREEFGIYMVGDSRINIAGLNKTTVPILADAIAQVIA